MNWHNTALNGSAAEERQVSLQTSFGYLQYTLLPYQS